MNWKGAEELRPLLKEVDSLSLMPGNPHIGRPEAIAKSYDQFGQRKPVVALPNGTVISGNHQLLAASILEWTHLAVVTVNDTDQEAAAFALADNRTGSLGWEDNDLLLAVIASVNDAELLSAASYELQDIDRIRKLADSAGSNTGWETKADMEESSASYRVLVEFRSSDDMGQFFELVGGEPQPHILWPS